MLRELQPTVVLSHILNILEYLNRTSHHDSNTFEQAIYREREGKKNKYLQQVQHIAGKDELIQRRK